LALLVNLNCGDAKTTAHHSTERPTSLTRLRSAYGPSALQIGIYLETVTFVISRKQCPNRAPATKETAPRPSNGGLFAFAGPITPVLEVNDAERLLRRLFLDRQPAKFNLCDNIRSGFMRPPCGAQLQLQLVVESIGIAPPQSDVRARNGWFPSFTCIGIVTTQLYETILMTCPDKALSCAAMPIATAFQPSSTLTSGVVRSPRTNARKPSCW
jgi:hypothetical protein